MIYRYFKSMEGKSRNVKTVNFMVWDQRVAGSNPATPTKEKALLRCIAEQGFVFLSVERLLSKAKEKQKPVNERSE